MIVNELKEYVLCSGCRKFNYGLGQYQCKKGHMICPRCQPFTDICPKCFVFVDINDPIRCHSSVDLLMDKVPVPCIYKHNGCMEKDQRGKLREHLFICPFRDLDNVVDATEETGTAEAGAIVVGDESRDREDDAGTAEVAEEVADGPEPVNTDDIMEAEEDQPQESGVIEVGNDRVFSAAEDEADIEMEELEGSHDASLNEEENSDDGTWIADEDDSWMLEENLGAFSSLGPRKGTRKRKMSRRYSPTTFELEATSSMVKDESEEEDETVVPEPVITDSFECTFCGQKFRNGVRMIKHLASYHAEPVTEKGTQVVYRRCMFCDIRFQGKDDLREHISDMHQDMF